LLLSKRNVIAALFIFNIMLNINLSNIKEIYIEGSIHDYLLRLI